MQTYWVNASSQAMSVAGTELHSNGSSGENPNLNMSDTLHSKSAKPNIARPESWLGDEQLSVNQEEQSANSSEDELSFGGDSSISE